MRSLKKTFFLFPSCRSLSGVVSPIVVGSDGRPLSIKWRRVSVELAAWLVAYQSWVAGDEPSISSISISSCSSRACCLTMTATVSLLINSPELLLHWYVTPRDLLVHWPIQHHVIAGLGYTVWTRRLILARLPQSGVSSHARNEFTQFTQFTQAPANRNRSAVVFPAEIKF